MNEQERKELLDCIWGLMLADNLGDVHEEIDRLCELAGIQRPDGDFITGWTDEDKRRVGAGNER